MFNLLKFWSSKHTNFTNPRLSRLSTCEQYDLRLPQLRQQKLNQRALTSFFKLRLKQPKRTFQTKKKVQLSLSLPPYTPFGSQNGDDLNILNNFRWFIVIHWQKYQKWIIKWWIGSDFWWFLMISVTQQLERGGLFLDVISGSGLWVSQLP